MEETTSYSSLHVHSPSQMLNHSSPATSCVCKIGQEFISFCLNHIICKMIIIEIYASQGKGKCKRKENKNGKQISAGIRVWKLGKSSCWIYYVMKYCHNVSLGCRARLSLTYAHIKV